MRANLKPAIVSASMIVLACLAACSDQPDTATSPSGTAAQTTAATASVSTTAPASESAPAETDAIPMTEREAEPQTVTDLPTDFTSADALAMVENVMSEQGIYTDSLGNIAFYSYALPRLIADTADAQAINAEIDAYFGTRIREEMDGIDKGLSLSLSTVSYSVALRQNVLSLVILGEWDADYDEYRVYCYDCAAGRRLDTAAMLAEMGVSEQRFLDACKTGFRQYFERKYAMIPEEEWESSGYNEALGRVDSEAYVNMDLMAYPEANGNIVVIAPIVSLAGAEYYYYPMKLDLNKAN